MAMLPPDPLYIFKGDMGPVFCLMFKKTGENIALYAGTQTGMVHVWDLNINRQIDSFQSSKESCISLKSASENTEIITQDKMGVIKFWAKRNEAWIKLKEITTEYCGFCRSALHNDCLYVPLQKAFMESIFVKSKRKGNILSLVEADSANEIMCFKIFDMNNETFALVAFESCEVCLYNLKDKRRLSSVKTDECPMALDFDVKSLKGVCGCPTEKVLVFTINKNYEMQAKKEIVLKNPGVASLAIRPDGKILALGCWDGKMRLYSMKTLSILAVLDIHLSTIQDVAFFNVEEDYNKPLFYLAGASKDGKMSLWDLYNN